MKKFAKEFREFISRGNVMDMAVGVIIGGAFSSIVTSLTGDIIMPIIGAIIGGLNFTALSVTIGDAAIMYGNFIQAIFNFLIIALVIFCMIKAINGMREKMEKLAKKEEEEAAPAAPAGPTTEELLSEIRDLLKNNK